MINWSKITHFLIFRYSKYYLYPIIANLSDFKRGQIVDACMVGTSVPRMPKYSVSQEILSKKSNDCLWKRKCPQQRTSLAESWNCLREIIGFHFELLERTVELQSLKLFLSLMNTLKILCPQKLPARKNCNSNTNKCFKAFRVVYDPLELVPWGVEKNNFPIYKFWVTRFTLWHKHYFQKETPW